MKHALTIFLFLSCLSVFAQAQPAWFSRTHLQQDIQLIQQVCKEAHPGFGRFNDPVEVYRSLDSLSSSLPDSMRLEDFFKKTNPLVARLNCGHTKYHPAFSTMKSYPYYFNPVSVIPLHIKLINGKMYVLWSEQNHIPAGSEIVRINGESVTGILAVLRVNQFADGNVQTSKERDIENQFASAYANFIDSPAEFEFEFIHKGKRSVSTLPGIPVKQWEEAKKALPVLFAPVNELKQINDSTVLLRLADFSSDKGRIKRFIASSFKTIAGRGIKHLIIDVRGNQGGYDRLGSFVYQYLARKPFSYYDRIEVKAGSVSQLSFREHASFNKLSGLFSLFIARSGSKYYWTRHRNLQGFKPAANVYKGKVYFLMDGSSYSVTAELLSVARSNNRAYFIGEESGGAYQGNNSGTFAFVNLPNTKTVFAVPLGGYYMNVSDANRPSGVLPDIEVENNIEAILSNHDTVLDRALLLIRENQVPTRTLRTTTLPPAQGRE